MRESFFTEDIVSLKDDPSVSAAIEVSYASCLSGMEDISNSSSQPGEM